MNTDILIHILEAVTIFGLGAGTIALARIVNELEGELNDLYRRVSRVVNIEERLVRLQKKNTVADDIDRLLNSEGEKPLDFPNDHKEA